jgi:hypothetical protein
MPRLFALFVLAAALVACRTQPLDFDGGVPGASGDMAGVVTSGRDLAVHVGPDLHAAPTSCCGAPGNPGNELGVGQFCQVSSDCTGKANICAAMFQADLTFCTEPCLMGGSPTQCGSGAQCQCGNGQCACIPGECVMPPPGC